VRQDVARELVDHWPPCDWVCEENTRMITRNENE
jgi:hypothetical protein